MGRACMFQGVGKSLLHDAVGRSTHMTADGLIACVVQSDVGA